MEEQFYLAWPLVVIALHLGLKRRASGRSDASLLFALIVICVGGLAGSVYLSWEAPHAGFYLMPSRIWQFALGAIVYLTLASAASKARLHSRMHPDFISRWMLATGLFLIAASALTLDAIRSYPGFWALPPSAGAALVIAAGHPWIRTRRNPLAHPAITWVGDRSYSWYLWHWPILVLGTSHAVSTSSLPTGALVALSLFAAALSYRVVELPVWRGRFSHGPAPRHILISLLVMTMMVGGWLNGPLARLTEQLPRSQIVRWRGDIPPIYAKKCDAWFEHARVEPCVFGPEHAPKTVVLLGDSIGAPWFSALPALFPEPEWRIVVLTKSACPMVDEDFFYARIGQTYAVCTEWRENVIAEMATLRPDILIMGSAITAGFTPEQWVNGSRRVIDRLAAAAGQVVVIAGTPYLSFDGPLCLHERIGTHGQLSADSCVDHRAVHRARQVAGYLAQAVAGVPNAHLLDLNDIVCPAGACRALSGTGIAVFRDHHHLTDLFVKASAGIVQDRLANLGIR